MADLKEKSRESNGKVGGLTVKVNVDVSEALTGLKALQRESKKALRALALLGTGNGWLSEVPTKELIEELKKRVIFSDSDEKGRFFDIRPYGKAILHWDTALDYVKKEIEGPADVFIFKK